MSNATATAVSLPTSKKELAELSQDLKLALDMGRLPEAFYFCANTNEMLKLYYGLNTELKTFKQWKEAGYKVKKGSKAFKFWSKPITGKEKAKSEETETAESKYQFFGVCNLFSAEQVEKF